MKPSKKSTKKVKKRQPGPEAERLVLEGLGRTG
jgi:hypothetical protein